MGEARVVTPGARFTRLVVLHLAAISNGHRMWACQCDCGTVKLVEAANLRSGDSRSCGCLHSEASAVAMKATATIHGLSGHPLHGRWRHMHQRCENPADKNYKHYGGRGIFVSDRWSGPDGFPNFLADLGECPPGLSLDRIDNDGPYSKANCRWSTASEQNRNRRKRKARRAG